MRTGASCLELCEQITTGFTHCVTLWKLHTLSVYNQCYLPSRLSLEGGLKYLGVELVSWDLTYCCISPEDGNDNLVAGTKAHTQWPR